MNRNWIESVKQSTNNDDVKVNVNIKEGRKDNEGIYGNITFGFASPERVTAQNPKKITEATIDLYPKAYDNVVNASGADYRSSAIYNGEIFYHNEYSVIDNTSATFDHEIEHIFQ